MRCSPRDFRKLKMLKILYESGDLKILIKNSP